MKNILFLFLNFATTLVFSQNFTIKGVVLEEATKQPLEYATVTLEVPSTEKIYGGITSSKGEFKVEAPAGVYVLKVQFFSFKTHQVQKFILKSNTNLGTILLHDEVEQIEGVEVVGQKSSVEMRLDKKIYNVGEDMTIKGGSVTDVLDNVPSISVDNEGGISLRGSENVRILINGKPSALVGMTAETLKQLPADMIEKVEVITNPSARYDAEGTAGIINIVLKQGKGLGLTGSVSASVGIADTENASGSLNLNLRKQKWTFFNTTSYRYNRAKGIQNFNQKSFDAARNIRSYQDEYRENWHLGNGFNTNFGAEYRPTDKISITNTLFFGKQKGGRDSDVHILNYDASRNLVSDRMRISDETETSNHFQYGFNYDHQLGREGHKLTAEYQFSTRKEDEFTAVSDNLAPEKVEEFSKNQNHLAKIDYVLPFGKESQFEAGYQGSFKSSDVDYQVFNDVLGTFILNSNYSNHLIYKENINSFYTQIGSKFGKFNAMAGLRLEDTNISISQINQPKNLKKYTSLFPSVFLGYAFTEDNQLSISYSRRLQRPMGRFINPFTSRSSNTNLFKGNPDLDPTFTNAFDLGYLTKLSNTFSVNTSAYYNYSTDVFSMVAFESGEFVSVGSLSIPVMITTPLNLANQHRFGAELTATYNPKPSLRFSWNFNFFKEETTGEFSYQDYLGQTKTQDLGVALMSWFSRLSAKVMLPFNVDFQTTAMYTGPRKTAQSDIEGNFFVNASLSKEVLNKKGTISVNATDIFNSRKMRSHIVTPNVESDNVMQFRPRQILLNFTYRFGGMSNNTPKRPNQRQNNGQNQPDGMAEMFE